MSITELMESVPNPFEERVQNFYQRLAVISSGTNSGKRNIFDNFCKQIYPFCLEIYESKLNHEFSDDTLTPSLFEDLIFDIGNQIAEHVMPFNTAFHKTSQALNQMVRDIVNEDRFRRGRISFISEIWSKIGRTDGIQIHRLLADQRLQGVTISTLLMLGDGRFVEEARQILQNDPNNLCRDEIVQYIEQYIW